MRTSNFVMQLLFFWALFFTQKLKTTYEEKQTSMSKKSPLLWSPRCRMLTNELNIQLEHPLFLNGYVLQTGWHSSQTEPPRLSPAPANQPMREFDARPQFRLRPQRFSIGQKLRVSMENVTELQVRLLVGPDTCPSFYINKSSTARVVPCCV